MQTQARRRRLLEQFGGKCERCGYSRCMRALHFHHRDSSEKQEWSKGYHGTSPNEVEAHPERFMVVCANCHAELHEEADAQQHSHTTCDFCGKAFRTQPHRSGVGRGKYCSKECVYDAWNAHAISTEGIMARFWKHTTRTDGCWEWYGQKLDGRYPYLQVKQANGKYTIRLAYRLAYEHLIQPLPAKAQLVRTCGNDNCVNPYHCKLR